MVAILQIKTFRARQLLNKVARKKLNVNRKEERRELLRKKLKVMV